MNRIAFSPEQSKTALACAKAVALVDGVFHDTERRLLVAAAGALECDVDIDALEPVSPAAAVAVFDDPVVRERLVQALIVLASIDGEVTQDELALIRHYAEALGVEDPRLCDLSLLIDERYLVLKYDLLFRSRMVGDVVREGWRREGLGGVWKLASPLTGLHKDPALAQRYQDLAKLPEHTLGHAYLAHIKSNGFSFPGEVRGFPELLVKHDLCHVLGDYPTTSKGECDLIAFISGFNRSDPFGYLFMVMMHMQFAVEVFDGTPTDRMKLDPEAVVANLQRGRAVNRDLYEIGWDFWPLFERPLDEVRATYNILPKAQFETATQPA
jgi:tellurite resistance protein